jgi:hypothetical protein
MFYQNILTMKPLNKLLFFIAGIGLLIACSKSDPFWGDEPLGNTMKDGHAEPIEMTLPLKVDLIGEYISFLPDEECGYSESNPFMYRVIVDFTGTGTHLGNIEGNFNFCCNVSTGVYGPTDSYFTAANGDILYVSCQGQVINGRLDDHPDYVISYWRDPFVILGGTGRFEGATGGGMTDDYNSDLDPYAHHHWSGTITLVKGKQ